VRRRSFDQGSPENYVCVCVCPTVLSDATASLCTYKCR